MKPDTRVAFSELRKQLDDGTLASPRVFLALGQYVRAKVGDRRGEYGAATLEKLGTELRRDFPGVFLSQELAPILQSAIRFAKAYSENEIRAIERRCAAAGSFRLSVSHLNYLASAGSDKSTRQKWVEKCFAGKWSARKLHEQLKKTFDEPRSKGGRLLPSPEVGVLSIEAAVRALERLFAHDSIREQWKSLSRTQKDGLRERLARCRKTLRKLEDVERVPIG